MGATTADGSDYKIHYGNDSVVVEDVNDGGALPTKTASSSSSPQTSQSEFKKNRCLNGLMLLLIFGTLGVVVGFTVVYLINFVDDEEVNPLGILVFIFFFVFLCVVVPRVSTCHVFCFVWFIRMRRRFLGCRPVRLPLFKHGTQNWPTFFSDAFNIYFAPPHHFELYYSHSTKELDNLRGKLSIRNYFSQLSKSNDQQVWRFKGNQSKDWDSSFHRTHKMCSFNWNPTYNTWTREKMLGR